MKKTHLEKTLDTVAKRRGEIRTSRLKMLISLLQRELQRRNNLSGTE